MRIVEIGSRMAVVGCWLILPLVVLAPGLAVAAGMVTHTQVVIWDLGAFEAALPGLQSAPQRLKSPDSNCRLQLLSAADYARLLKHRGMDRAVSAPLILTKPGEPRDLDYSWVDKNAGKTRRVGLLLEVEIESEATRLDFRLTDKDELGVRHLVDRLLVPTGHVAVMVVRAQDGSSRRLMSVCPVPADS